MRCFAKFMYQRRTRRMFELFRRWRCELLHDDDYWPVGSFVRCKKCLYERPNVLAIQAPAPQEKQPARVLVEQVRV